MEDATLEFQLNPDRISRGYDVILQSSSDVGLMMGLESGKPNLGKDYMSEGITLQEPVRRNQWYHIIIYREGSKWKMTAGKDTTDTDLDVRNEDVLYLGRSKERNFFTGKSED